MKIIKKLFCIFFLTIFCFFLLPINYISGDELSDINDQKNKKQGERKQQQQLLKDVNYSITSTSNLLSYLSGKISSIESAVSTLNKDKLTLEKQISDLSVELAGTSGEYNVKYEEYQKEIVDIYKIGTDYDHSLTELRGDYDDIETVVYLNEIQRGIYQSLVGIEEKIVDYQVKSRDLVDAYENLKETESYLKQLQDVLKVQKAQYQVLLSSWQAEKKRVESEINNLDKEIANLDAEAKRIIASKYPSDSLSGGGAGTGTKPLKSDVGYYQVIVKDSGSQEVKNDVYLKGPIRISSNAPLGVNGLYKFKGTLEARGDTNVYLISELPVEDYIKGLGEVPSSWGASGGMEALKAQAIIGRTYFIANVNKRSKYKYDLLDSTDDQYYSGYNKETESYGNLWVSAVDSTSGQVVVYSGKPIATYYSSSAAGHTLSSEEVWISALPYARGVSDWIDPASGTSYDSIAGSPYIYKLWGNAGVSKENLIDILNYAINKYNLGSSIESKVGDIVSLQHVYNGGSTQITNDTKRTETLIIQGTKGTYSMNADYFRVAYNVKAPGNLAIWSKLWDVVSDGGVWKFFSRGFGHKVGLSQYGAYGMSLKGFNFEQILKHYYTNIELSTTNTNFNARIGLTKIPKDFYIDAYDYGYIVDGNGKSIQFQAGDRIILEEQ